MHSHGVFHSSARRVRPFFLHLIPKLILSLSVTDMLLSLLNICTKEELEEAEEGPADAKETAAEHAERKRVIKNKILAVGRVSRVFALLRYVFCRTFPVAPTHDQRIERSLSVFLSSRALRA